VQLNIEDLVVVGDRGERAVDGLSLQVKAREIVGVAGVAGNGQKALMQALTGQRPIESGSLQVAGQDYRATRAQNALQRVRSLPEEPLQNACVKDFSVSQNMALRSFDQAPFSRMGFLRFAAMTEYAKGLIAQFHVKTQSPHSAIGQLSGGNVQRAVLARELSEPARLLLVSNPVFGLDFASVSEIHHRLLSARNSGTAVLLLSEDLDELLQMSDRILVMVQGKIVFEVEREQADRHVIGAYMGGDDRPADLPGQRSADTMVSNAVH
jgi:simple sugar transport system ATP-binding protein